MGELKHEQITSLRKGSYMIIDGAPCVIIDMQTSKTGKHGHAKCRIEAVGIIDGKKRIFVKPGHEKAEVPIVEKKAAQVLSINGDTANVMDMETYETFDLKIPDDLKDQIKEGVQILYWIILKDKIMKQVK